MEPSKRPVGRPKGSRDIKPRKRSSRPPKWLFMALGRIYNFYVDVPLLRRVAISVLTGGKWRKL